jgi:hypothetical protein
MLFLPAALCVVACRSAAPAIDPARILVKPLFLIARDAPAPSAGQGEILMRQMTWAQTRYRELLAGQSTFAIAEGSPFFVASCHSIAELEASHDGGAEAALLELMARDGVDRLSCPYIYVVLFAGTGEWPGGGARPINGGLNTGGGIVVLAADVLATAPNFQSTLQHELGHAFGLPHVDVYGYDMMTNSSLMSYNPGHHTNFFAPSATPGAFIPEDRRALAMNRRAFPEFVAHPERDDPAGYELAPLVMLGPMELYGQGDYTGPAIVK